MVAAVATRAMDVASHHYTRRYKLDCVTAPRHSLSRLSSGGRCEPHSAAVSLSRLAGGVGGATLPGNPSGVPDGPHDHGPWDPPLHHDVAGGQRRSDDGGGDDLP